MTKERDEARTQLAGLKETEQRVTALVAENTELKQKLASAEQTVREIGEDKPKKEQELAEVKKQLEDLRAQLAASQQQNKDFEVTVASLRSQLQEASSQLEKAKLTGSDAEETAKLTRENQITAKHRHAGTSGRSAPRPGAQADAGRVRQAKGEIGHT